MDQKQLTTLCYIESEDSYLMLHRVKKKNDMNQDKWLGIGGHFKEGESPEECLLREAKEETGLTLTSFRSRGLVTFTSDAWPSEYMCLYTAWGYEGSLSQCEEGSLQWVKKENIHSLNLWEGDKIFFQLLTDNHPFFSLKLSYKGNRLSGAWLDGKELELLDERDEMGEVTGRTQARLVMHRSGQLHGTAHVWLIRPNDKSGFDLLLQKRSKNKDAFPGCYDISSAGHLPAGWDYLPSAVRELKEELGLEVSEKELHFAGVCRNEEKTEFHGKPFYNREISQVFVCTLPVKEEELTLQKEEVEAVLWMDYEECLKGMREEIFPHCLEWDELYLVKKWAKKWLSQRC